MESVKLKVKTSFRISLLCIAAVLNGGAMMIASAVLQAEPNVPFCLFFGAFLTVAFYGVGMLFRRVNIFAVIIGMAVVLLLLWRVGVFSQIWKLAQNYVEWFYNYALETGDPPAFAVIITLILAGIVTALFTTPLVAATPRVFAVIMVFLVIAFLPYPYTDPVQLKIATNMILIALLYLTVLSGYTRMASRYNGKLHTRPYQLLGLPICGAIMIISLVLPFNPNGHPELVPAWLLPSQGNGIFKILPFKTGDLTLNNTGRVELGGSNSMGETLLFDVRTDELFYLYADTYDRYTGTSWRSVGNQEFAYSTEWYNILQGGDGRIFAGANDKAVPMSFLYHNLSTDRLLLPRNISKVGVTSEGYRMFVEDDLTFTVSPDAGNGFAYQAWAYKHPIDEIIRFADELDAYAYLSSADFSRYLVLPETVTERTRELAAEITASAGNTVEKVLAIQKYLSTTYPYTLNAPTLPEGADFADFFLFEAKTGYCTSYATAMAVMLRTLDIPARYCEGFAPNAANKEDGVYRVYESDAHAWVEVYIPIAGWVEFDPTGTDNAALYRDSQTLTPSDEEATAPSPTPGNGAGESPSPTPEPTQNSEDTGGEFEPDVRKTVDEILMEGFIRILKFILMLLAIAAIPVAWVFGGRLYVRLMMKRIAKMSVTKQAYFCYDLILDLLKSEGHVIREYETMREFVERVQKDLP